VACFSLSNKNHQLTTFSPQLTINSPQKNHVLHPTFSKTPLKNTSKNNETPA